MKMLVKALIELSGDFLNLHRNQEHLLLVARRAVTADSRGAQTDVKMAVDNETLSNVTSQDLPKNQANTKLDLVVTTIMTIMLFFIMLAMGCTVSFTKMWNHIKRPWGILVGFVCQFGLMPLIGFVLSFLFQLKTAAAFAVVLTGSCPGGLGSNIATFWIDGDMDLSICMTVCSTLFSMGMIPLCLLIYTSHWDVISEINIPYEKISFSLLLLIIPISIGAFINYKWPNKAKLLVKIGSIIGIVLLCLIGIGVNWLYKDMWKMNITFLMTGIIFPCIGFALGFVLAWIARMPWQRCRTISLETGIQNANLCSIIIKISFPAEVATEMIFFPMVYSCSSIIFGIAMVIVYRIYEGKKSKNTEMSKNTDECNVEENLTPKSCDTSKVDD
eukprot:gi/632966569/ref/XP_007899491.1/ PREDICTED: ileal sodium/bile acid cotransporter-like isoform X1 [Callorhinchus milii]